MRYVIVIIAIVFTTFANATYTTYMVTDSIGLLYQMYLDWYLNQYDDFIVTHCPGNANSSNYTVLNIDSWLEGDVHYDVGILALYLHDIAHNPDPLQKEVPAETTPEKYEENMEQIIIKMMAHCDHLIIVGGTVVPPSYPQDYRNNADFPLYDSKLRYLAGKYHCRYVNLYGPTASNLQWYPEGEVHPYNPPGLQILGGIVGDAVLQEEKLITVPILSNMGTCIMFISILIIGIYIVKRYNTI